MLSPQWLRTFATLAEQGNFTRTAERLDLTQAAVSQHVQRLEERLGLLLIRRPRQIELTPAGLALLDYCAENGIVAEDEVIPMAKINESFERMLKGDVKYRFVIDMASVKQTQ